MVDINKIYSNMLENQELQEGINDTAIFKAVFLAGGPGSGKSFIGTEKKGKSPTTGGDPKIFMGGGQLGLINLGLRVVNPDPAYEKLLKDAGLDAKNSADIWSDKGQEIRVKATDLTAKQKSLYVDGRLGVVVDGTGANINKIKGQKSLLDKVGYECAMIYVNTNLETAIARDAKRDRTIGADKVTEMWNNVQKNLKSYEGIFGKSNMYVIDNSDGSNWNAEAKKAHKKLEKWIRKDPTDPKAKAWIETQKMRNAPKSGIKEEDSNYLPGYSAGFYGHDPYTPRARMQELHHDIRRCSSINDACNEVSEKWHKKLAELSKTNATHLDDLDDEDIAILLPYAEEMRKEQMSLSEGFVELDENFIAFDYDHEVLTHFQTKADGMKWKNHKNAPDSYYLVKTKHRLLKGDMASEGSDSLSKHLDSQPFPKKDGANFSVHKESVEIDESVYDKKLAQAWKKVKSVPNVRGISNSGQNHAKKLSSLLKGSPDKLTFEKLELALGTYETHAYKAAEDKKNPHGKEDLAKLEEFCDSVDEVIGAMKNLHQSQLSEGFLDTMKQLVPGAKGKPAKKLNAEQVKISKQIDKKLKLIDGLMQKVKPISGQFGKLMAFRRLPLEKMTPKDLYRVLNDWYHDVEEYLDYSDDSVVLSKKYGRSVENLYERMEELALKIKDYMYASGYDVPHGGAKFQNKWLKKVDFSAPKRTDANFSVHKESVDLDEKGPKVDMKKYAAHMDRNKKKKTMSSTKKNLSSIAKRAEKKANEARDKFLNIETQLDELSPKTKKSYSDKANRAVDNEKKYAEKYSDAAKADPENPKYKKRADAHKRKAKNRAAGMKNAKLDELSMTKADLSKTGMKVDTKKMAELKKELARLKKGLKKESIDESTRFENESAEMVMRDLLIMQNKIIDLVEMMDIEMGASEMEELGLEPWVVAKITKAKDYLDSIHDYTVMDNDNDE